MTWLPEAATSRFDGHTTKPATHATAKPMPAIAREPSGTTVEVLCGQPEQ